MYREPIRTPTRDRVRIIGWTTVLALMVGSLPVLAYLSWAGR